MATITSRTFLAFSLVSLGSSAALSDKTYESENTLRADNADLWIVCVVQQWQLEENLQEFPEKAKST